MFPLLRAKEIWVTGNNVSDEEWCGYAHESDEHAGLDLSLVLFFFSAPNGAERIARPQGILASDFGALLTWCWADAVESSWRDGEGEVGDQVASRIRGLGVWAV